MEPKITTHFKKQIIQQHGHSVPEINIIPSTQVKDSLLAAKRLENCTDSTTKSVIASATSVIKHTAGNLEEKFKRSIPDDYCINKKLARKRKTSRSHFRHETLEFYKLGDGMTSTALCKKMKRATETVQTDCANLQVKHHSCLQDDLKTGGSNYFQPHFLHSPQEPIENIHFESKQLPSSATKTINGLPSQKSCKINRSRLSNTLDNSNGGNEKIEKSLSVQQSLNSPASYRRYSYKTANPNLNHQLGMTLTRNEDDYYLQRCKNYENDLQSLNNQKSLSQAYTVSNLNSERQNYQNSQAFGASKENSQKNQRFAEKNGCKKVSENKVPVKTSSAQHLNVITSNGYQMKTATPFPCHLPNISNTNNLHREYSSYNPQATMYLKNAQKSTLVTLKSNISMEIPHQTFYNMPQQQPFPLNINSDTKIEKKLRETETHDKNTKRHSTEKTEMENGLMEWVKRVKISANEQKQLYSVIQKVCETNDNALVSKWIAKTINEEFGELENRYSEDGKTTDMLQILQVTFLKSIFKIAENSLKGDVDLVKKISHLVNVFSNVCKNFTGSGTIINKMYSGEGKRLQQKWNHYKKEQLKVVIDLTSGDSDSEHETKSNESVKIDHSSKLKNFLTNVKDNSNAKKFLKVLKEPTIPTKVFNAPMVTAASCGGENTLSGSMSEKIIEDAPTMETFLELNDLHKSDTLDADQYVKEITTLEKSDVPNVFKEFYIFVSKLQIMNNQNPVSFHVFLDLHNHKHLSHYERRFWKYLAQKSYDP